MTRTLASGIAFIAAFVVCGVGWLILPSLQDAQRTADTEASVLVERARRLLDLYNPGLAYESLLAEQMRDLDLDVDLEDPDVLLGKSAADEYQTRHEDAWETYEPTDWEADPPRKRPHPSYGDIVRQGREGNHGRDQLLADNAGLLEEALAAVNQALAVTERDASARSHAEGNRLKGSILHHMGLARRTQADSKRREAEPYRRELIALATREAKVEASKSLVADSGIAEQISLLQEAAATAEAKVDEDRKALAAVELSIEDLERRLASARLRAGEARKAMNDIKTAGIDFSDPNGGEAFRARLLEQDRLHREALREAQSLEFGSYPAAQIDRGGDYLSGRYVESESTDDLTIAYGLTHYRDHRKVLAAQVEVKQQAADDLRSDVTRLEGMQASYRAVQDTGLEQLKAIRAKARVVFDELNKTESEAFAIEERALEFLDQSAQVSQQAARYADQWVNDALSRSRELSGQAKDRSTYARRSDDRWMSGYIAAQAADARLAKAWIFCERYSACTANAKVLADVSAPLELGEADADAEQTKAREAHDAGVEEVRLAVADLQDVHEKVGGHWTIVAQEAGVIYLLALLGHEAYIDEAIAAYRSALKGREDEEHVERLRVRLARLERL